MTLSEQLKLPEGFKAERFLSTIEISGPWLFKNVGFPIPYDPRPIEWWVEMAKSTIQEPQRDLSAIRHRI